jgi:hypothetical protein
MNPISREENLQQLLDLTLPKPSSFPQYIFATSLDDKNLDVLFQTASKGKRTIYLVHAEKRGSWKLTL